MSKQKYGSVRTTGTVTLAQGLECSSIQMQIGGREFKTVKNVAMYTFNKSDYIVVGHEAGIKTFGKVDYIRKQEGFQVVVLRIPEGKKLGQYFNLTEAEIF